MDADKRFHDLLLIFSLNSRVQLTPIHFEIYDDAFREVGLSYDLAAAATKRLLQKARSWQLPTPAQIIDEAMPKVQAIDEANNIAGLIVKAIRDHGYSNERLARAAVGELAWMVVDRHGGWNLICTGDHDIGQLRAQMRDSAKAVLEIARVRPLEQLPQLADSPVSRTIGLLAQGKEMPK